MATQLPCLIIWGDLAEYLVVGLSLSMHSTTEHCSDCYITVL